MSEYRYITSISSYYLFLDDIRDPKNVSKLNDMLVEWVKVRSYKDFCSVVDQLGIPIFVSYDHDLGPEAMKESTEKNFQTFNYDNITEKTGLDCCRYLINKCRQIQICHPTYVIHSINAAGARNIEKEILDYNAKVEEYYKNKNKILYEH